MRLVYLAFAVILTLWFMIDLLRGKRYRYLVENLSGGDYPLKGIYCVGFFRNEMKLFSLRGKIKELLIGQAKLLYNAQYAEYYAVLAWAQMLAFVHLCLMIGFLLAGALNSSLMLAIGLVSAAVFGFYFVNRMNDRLKSRCAACTAELPEVVSTMALLINAGMTLKQAWFTIAKSKNDSIYELMQQACAEMENGSAEVDAIHRFGKRSNSSEVRKFTGALAQSMERGGQDLADFLGRQSIELWVLKKQTMLQKGEAAASKLLAPTALLFVAIIIAVISGALGMLI